MITILKRQGEKYVAYAAGENGEHSTDSAKRARQVRFFKN
jgi:hypothetical protein